MDIGSLPVIVFLAFTAILTCVSVGMLCRALKRNNEHVRMMLAELGKLKDVRPSQAAAEQSAPPSAHLHQPSPSLSSSNDAGSWTRHEPSPHPPAAITALYQESAAQIVDPAADGTPVYIHSKSGAMPARSTGIRSDVAMIPAPAVQPMYLHERLNDQPFAGILVVIGVTAPGSPLMTSLRQLIPISGSERGIEAIAPDEFLLTYSAQRPERISLYELGQKLWEIQLHALSSSSDMLVWTAIEVSGQSLPDAIALAQEQLREEREIRIMLAAQTPLRTPVAIYASLLGRLLALRKSNKASSREHPELVILFAGPQ